MAYPKSMHPPPTPRVVRQAKHMLVMPGANTLTRELTATILKRYGLLNTPVTSVGFFGENAKFWAVALS
jgi:hypothetical protein